MVDGPDQTRPDKTRTDKNGLEQTRNFSGHSEFGSDFLGLFIPGRD